MTEKNLQSSDRQPIARALAKVIYHNKGFNIVVLDVRGVSTLTDYFIIAEGSVDRHVKALGKAVVEEMEKEGDDPIHIEGRHACDWLALDYGDIIIHIFTSELREMYSIERIWHEGKIMNVDYPAPNTGEGNGRG